MSSTTDSDSIHACANGSAVVRDKLGAPRDSISLSWSASGAAACASVQVRRPNNSLSRCQGANGSAREGKRNGKQEEGGKQKLKERGGL